MKSEDQSIWGAAREVLLAAKQPLTAEQIHAQIEERGLYNLNTPTPLSVVTEQIRRHCAGLDRGLSYEPTIFIQKEDGRYTLANTNSQTRRASMRRIQRASDKEDVIDKLTSGDPPVFKEIWRLMLFAVAVGFRNKKRLPLEKWDSGKGIDARIFDNSPIWPGIVHLIALVEEGNPHALSVEQEDFRVQLFEEYANGGLHIIRELLEAKSYSADAMIAFVFEETLGSVPIVSEDLLELQL